MLEFSNRSNYFFFYGRMWHTSIYWTGSLKISLYRKPVVYCETLNLASYFSRRKFYSTLFSFSFSMYAAINKKKYMVDVLLLQ
jgi:hypothetical protein